MFICFRCILFIAFLFSFFSCSNKEGKSETIFTLLDSSYTGINFVNNLPINVMTDDNVLSSQYYYNGGGVAIGDVNNDGLSDIYLTANKSSNKLFLNLGNLKFKDVTEEAGVGSNRFSTGATFVDINNDGFLDLYVCNSGVKSTKIKDRANQFYINQGDGTFKELAKEYRINDPNFSTHAAFFDYDKDGDLDLYVLNYSIDFRGDVTKRDYNDNDLKQYSGRMLENLGLKFKDVTKESGLLHYGYGLGVAVSDINNDNWPDLYVANDFTIPDKMFINNGDKTFTDKIKSFTNQTSWFSMGVDISDFNNDGFVDIGLLDMASQDHVRGKIFMASMDPNNFYYLVNELGYQYQYMFNSLQINNGNNTFSNIANLSGVAKTDWSWAPLFADFNNDGFKDYFVSNGYRRVFGDNDFQIKLNRYKKLNKLDQKNREVLYYEMPELQLPNKLYINDKNLKFRDLGEMEGVTQGSFSNGAAYGDLDNDGDLDLVVNNIDQETFIYRNNSEQNSNSQFLKVNLLGEIPSDYYGAKVTLFYGEKMQLQEYSLSRGFMSSVEHNLHFGLLKNVESIDSIVVNWIDGTKNIMKNIACNQILNISKNSGLPFQNSFKENTLFSTMPANSYGIDFVHSENDYNDFTKENLLPHKQSCLGPFSSVGDVNNDQLDDVFIGGASNQSGKIYIQNKLGQFSELKTNVFNQDKICEDMGSIFFDYDGDGDLDLYVVSGGGGEFDKDSDLLQDRLYINNGRGDFVKSQGVLPLMITSGQKVKAEDVDDDGDLDLFIGGRTLPGVYPYSPRSFLLINNNGTYEDVTESWNSKLKYLGMVTDFIFSDIDRDNKPDLIIVGEWENIKVFRNTGNSFAEASSEYDFSKLSGWWYSIASGDFNNDGQLDYLVGNIGENIKFKASEKEPFHIFTNDFDNSGDQDIVLSYYYNGELVPSRGRECSSGDMPFITEKCKTYKEFAESSLEEVYGSDKLESANHLTANIFGSIIILSSPEGYAYKKLNIEAQFAPINRFIVEDVNQDGNLDFIIGGNMYHTEVETARYDAGTGRCFLGDGTGSFNVLSVNASGIYIDQDVKDINPLIINDKTSYLVTNNNDAPQIIIKE